MADITPEKRQEFTQLSNEYGDTVDSVNEFSDSDIAGGAFILPGFVEGDAQHGILPRWGKMSYAKLRKPIEDAMAEWNGDGTAQNPGMEARVNAAISAAEAVSVEWQGADGTGGIKKQAQDATSAATTAAGNASSAAATATSAAGTATSAAGAATTAANTANEKAALADQKATLADQKAALADTAATNANTEAGKATTATGNANDAADNANAKATLANNAADAATSAAQSATTAASAATTAAGSANTAASDANSAASAANTAATGASNVNAQWNGTTTQLIVTDRTGTSVTKDLKGEKGDTGDPFAIYRTYASVSAMNADASNVPAGKFVCIASNVEDPDNAKLYVKNSSGSFTFLTDLSGAQGIKGDKGDEPALTANNAGEIFSDGVLLTDAIKNAVNAFTSNEGTSTSPRTENSRWGKYAQAEYERNAANQTAEGISSSTAGDGSRWGAYKTAENARDGQYATAESNRNSQYNTSEASRDTSYGQRENTRDAQYSTAEGSSTSTAGDGSRWGTYKTAENAREQSFTTEQTNRDTTWSNWFSDVISTGVRKVWNDWFNATKQAWTTWFGTSTNSGVQKQVADAVTAANNAATEASRVNASLNGTTITVTNRNGQSSSANLKGETGDAAGFGTPTATIIDNTTGTPSVEITATGSDTAKVFDFKFSHLKGEKGDDLHYDDMSEEEKQHLIDNIKADLVFATPEETRAMLNELT